MEAFNADLRARADDGANRMVQEDLALLDALERRAPEPLLFVNGRPVEGTPTLEQLEALVAQEIEAAKAFVEANPAVDRAGLYDAMRRGWSSFDQLEAATAEAPAR